MTEDINNKVLKFEDKYEAEMHCENCQTYWKEKITKGIIKQEANIPCPKCGVSSKQMRDYYSRPLG